MTVRSRGISSRCSSTSSAGTRIAPGSLASDSPQAFGLRVSIKANCSPRFILSFTSSTVTLVGSIISLLHIAPIIFSAVDKSTQAACRPAAIILPLVTSLKPDRRVAALYGYTTELYRTSTCHRSLCTDTQRHPKTLLSRAPLALADAVGGTCGDGL